MNRISVLGCGWLGKELAISFVESGYEVNGSTTTESKLNDLEAEAISPFLVDISDFEMFDTFLDADILVVAITSKDVAAFERFIEQVQESPIQKVIFISSTSVYPTRNRTITEEDAVVENELTVIENLFRENTYFETTILRFAGLFGGERHPANWFVGRKIPHPEGYVNMIHREDCIGIIHAIIDQNAWNTTYNACADHHPTRRAFYTKAKLSKSMELPQFIEDKPLEWKVVSSKKLVEELEYSFAFSNLLKI